MQIGVAGQADTSTASPPFKNNSQLEINSPTRFAWVEAKNILICSQFTDPQSQLAEGSKQEGRDSGVVCSRPPVHKPPLFQTVRSVLNTTADQVGP